MTHLALYGNTGIVRAFCRSCKTTAFVIDGLLQCCYLNSAARPSEIKRIVEPEFKRRIPTGAIAKAILNAQDHCCLYCDRRFNETVLYRGVPKRVKLNWDHSVPFNFTADNRPSNFVAACNFCNIWKRDLMFQSLEEIKIYVAGKWEAAQKEQGTEAEDDLQELWD